VLEPSHREEASAETRAAQVRVNDAGSLSGNEKGVFSEKRKPSETAGQTENGGEGKS
jgi:hypothetical protein